MSCADRSQHESEKWFENCAAVLGEVHDESVYGAIERLVHAAEQVGPSVPEVIRMLRSGMTLECVLDLIDIRMTDALGQSHSRPARIHFRTESPEKDPKRHTECPDM
jgi:hypothetical protein